MTWAVTWGEGNRSEQDGAACAWLPRPSPDQGQAGVSQLGSDVEGVQEAADRGSRGAGFSQGTSAAS